jgi:hypothetical protein
MMLVGSIETLIPIYYTKWQLGYKLLENSNLKKIDYKIIFCKISKQ